MLIRARVNNFARRAIAILGTLVVCVTLSFAALVTCASGLLTDPRANVSRELLTAGIAFVPNSAPLNARLAEAEMSREDRDIRRVDSLATQAVNLSPWDYRQRLLLATVKEAEGDRAAAEQSLQEALALAPNYTEVRWRFANLLLREGKLGKSVPEFRFATASDPNLLPGALDLLWRVTSGSLVAAQAVTPRDPKSQVLLAQFLLKQSRPAEAITIISAIDRNSLVGLQEVPNFINSLVSEGRLDEARGLWVGLVSGTYAQPGRPLPGLWNGGFETDVQKNLAQFDWMISRNEFAAPVIDSNTSHTGSRSLRIEFAGRDTTRLDGQVKQTIIVRPGARYRLECYVKTDRLDSPEGPRITVTDITSSSEIAGSDPLPSGSNDWRLVAIDFTAPSSARAAVVSIRRIPKFSYDDPTRGTIWLDDFSLSELIK